MTSTDGVLSVKLCAKAAAAKRATEARTAFMVSGERAVGRKQGAEKSHIYGSAPIYLFTSHGVWLTSL